MLLRFSPSSFLSKPSVQTFSSLRSVGKSPRVAGPCFWLLLPVLFLLLISPVQGNKGSRLSFEDSACSASSLFSSSSSSSCPSSIVSSARLFLFREKLDG